MADLQVARLAAIGRLWGAAKLFHPNIATRAIDWDGALVAALAKTREARSPNDFRAAVDGLLAALGDPQTCSWKRPEPAATPIAEKVEARSRDDDVFKVVGDVVILHCHRVARLVSRDGAEALKNAAPTLEGERDAARGVVFDCRAGGAPTDERTSGDTLEYYLREAFAETFHGSIALGTYRFREHFGHRSDIFLANGSYWSALATRAPDSLEGAARPDAPSKPIVVIDDETEDFRELWSGLQCAGLARVVVARSARVAPMERPGDSYIDFDMPEGFQVRLRTTEFVNPDGRIGWRPDAEVSIGEPLGDDAALEAALALIADPSRATPYPSPAAGLALQGRNERRYAEMAFPDANYRLLGLFRLWNAIEYFFPYKHLMDSDWFPALAEFIPRFDACASALDYETTVAELATRLADSHVFVQLAGALNAERGAFAPPVTVALVEGSTCIVGLPSEVAVRSGLAIGDVVLAVDDEAAETRRARLARLFASSTPQALQRVVHWRLLCGPENSVARLRILDAGGEQRTVEIARDTRWQSASSPP